MGRCGRNDLEAARVPHLPKDPDQVALPVRKATLAFRKICVIELRESAKAFVAAVPFDFTRGQIDQMLEMPRVAISEELISQHRAKCRRHRHGELEGHLITEEPLHHGEERDITFRDRLEEPVLLKKLAVLRMPDEREMRVKKEREVA